MLGFPLIIVVIQLIAFLFIYNFETPAFIYNSTGDEEKTLKVLEKVYVKEHAIKELEMLIKV